MILKMHQRKNKTVKEIKTQHLLKQHTLYIYIMDDTQKLCPYCKLNKDVGYFVRTIQRRTYAPGCDEDGYTYYKKDTTVCLDCRVKQRVVMNTRNKYKREKMIR